MDSMLAKGTEVDGGYIIERMIDSGQMGEVYTGIRASDGHAVAIKLIHTHWVAKEEQLARFHQEVVAARKVIHPAVVQIFDVGQYGDRPFIVMELLRGTSLADFMAAGALSRREAYEFVLGALEPLAAAHHAGLVHRDFKPENIFVVGMEDANERVKLLDFGIARQLDTVSRTQTGLTMGTPLFMSPEQAARPETVSYPTNVWACGVLMYRFATGSYPFVGKTPTALLIKAVSKPHQPAQDDHFKVPETLAQVIDQCLVKDAHLRIQTAHDLLSILKVTCDEPDVRAWLDLDVTIQPDTKAQTAGRALDLIDPQLTSTSERSTADPRAATADLPSVKIDDARTGPVAIHSTAETGVVAASTNQPEADTGDDAATGPVHVHPTADGQEFQQSSGGAATTDDETRTGPIDIHPTADTGVLPQAADDQLFHGEGAQTAPRSVHPTSDTGVLPTDDDGPSTTPREPGDTAKRMEPFDRSAAASVSETLSPAPPPSTAHAEEHRHKTTQRPPPPGTAGACEAPPPGPGGGVRGAEGGRGAAAGPRWT
ncbi:MAG: protein kinase, partial [Myxococcota bacterium]|nr:protein kinase [Myxococcota bacterium]